MNILKLTAENPEELLNTSAFGAGALISVERAATQAGSYSVVGTVALVSGTTLYTYYDQSAAPGSWYRTRYTNAGNTNQSAYSDTFQASTEPDTYSTLYDVKQAIGKSPTDTSDDEELLQHLVRVADYITGKVHRRLLPDPATSYVFDGYGAVSSDGGRGCDTILVPQGVQSVSSITVATSTGGAQTALSASDYILRPLAQDRNAPDWPATRIQLTDVATYTYWPRAYGNITVTGAFGWSSVPARIEALAVRLTAVSWRGRNAGGADTFTVGLEGERVFDRSLSWEERWLLRSYDAAVYVG